MTGGRGKAEFTALREMAGISQSMIADQLGVHTKTVKCWESPSYEPQPSPEAWRVVENLIDKQIDFALAVRRMSDDGPVALRIVRITSRNTAAEIINARVRAAMCLLQTAGRPFTVSYAAMPRGAKIDMSQYAGSAPSRS